MARNPLYPRSAGETAVDKLLNQTLPRILSERANRKREDEQFEYRKAQDLKAEERYAASVDVAAEKTTYDRLQDDKADIRRAISFAKQSESDGDFSSSYDYYLEAEQLADSKGLTDEFQPIIDRSMNTGMVNAGNDNRFNSIFVKLKSGDDATFNKAMDDYLKMSSQNRISDANDKRFKALELLESKNPDSRFKSYYGSEVTDDYKDFNKQYQNKVFSKVGLDNKKEKPSEFAQAAAIAEMSTDDYYEERYGEQDRSAAALFLRTEVVGSDSFKNLYNNSSETMKETLNKTIVDAYGIANGKAIREQIIASGIKENDPTFENRVNQAIRNNALSPENLPGVKVKTKKAGAKLTDTGKVTKDKDGNVIGPILKREARTYERPDYQEEDEKIKLKALQSSQEEKLKLQQEKLELSKPIEEYTLQIKELKVQARKELNSEEGRKEARRLRAEAARLEKLIKSKKYKLEQKRIKEESVPIGVAEAYKRMDEKSETQIYRDYDKSMKNFGSFQ